MERHLFPGRYGVGGYDAYSQVRNRDWSDTYFQVAVGLAVTTRIPRSVTEIGATYFQVAVGLAVTTLIPRSASEIGGYDAYSQVRNGDLWSATGYDVYVQRPAGRGEGVEK